jgi:serine/threonine-protein kinase
MFAGYTIVCLIRTGSMGEVYLVEHPALQRRCVLRVLPTAMAADRKFRGIFMREAEAAARLHHPHIVGVHNHGEFDGQLWVATDYVNGTNTDELVRDRLPVGLPTGAVVAIVSVIAAALDYAHERGVLHRNVKPANILVTNSTAGGQRARLADFGIARPSGLITTNLTVGAVAYVAPEQLIDSDVGARADQYALAATAFYLLTARPPFADVNPVAVIGEHLNAAPPKLSDRHPELAHLDDVVASALAKNPADRFDSCRSFADTLRQRAGVLVDEHSFTANLGGVVDYPDDEAPRSVPESVVPARSPRSGLTRLRPKSPQLRRGWMVGSVVAAAAVLCTGLLATGIMIGTQNTEKSVGPTTSIRASAPAGVPSTTTPVVPGPRQTLDGTYRVDVNRAQQTFNGTPTPQPPNVSTWWAFHTSCTTTECVAVGIVLDDTDHQTPIAPGGGKPLTLDFHDGAWQSRPDAVQFSCVGPNGTLGEQDTTQTIRLQQSTGSLHGVMTVTVDSNECDQQGAEIRIPAVAERVAEVPAGVAVPAPPGR